MNRLGQNRLELALLLLIAVVCTGLSLLQYRWTGEVSQAERARLRSALNEEAFRFARAFDDEIRENCRALTPESAEIRDKGVQEAHASRFRDWASSHERGLFARIAIVVPEDGKVTLYEVDGQSAVVPIAWPAEWESLRIAMSSIAQGAGPPPSVPADSMLIEIPVFAESRGRHGGRGILEWMIFEVNEQRLRNETLPRLVQEYLNSGNEANYEASVTWKEPRERLVFSTRADKSSVIQGADLTTGLFPIRVADSPGRSRGRRSPRDDTTAARWTLAIRHQAGSLDAAVSRTRTRNLVTSLILIGLLAGAAWALVRYTARSRRLADMQFRFAVGVSHDLRTPLTAIRGAAFNIADGVVTERSAVERYARIILRNSEELTSMIENVLAFSASMQSGREEREETFAVGDLVEHAAAAVRQEAEQAGCRIDVEVAPDLPALQGDPLALDHAFRNLIANAARHAAQGKWIGVSATGSAGEVQVRVCDRGPGIPEEERQRIFEPFYRSERTRATQVRGTGLGLSLVKDTVERHRGTLSVHNSPAGGAEFTVHLPVTSGVA